MYEYLTITIIYLTIWFILYYLRKDLHKEMLWSSIIVTPAGILDYFFIPTYWNQETLFNLTPGVESFIFAFCLGGIASVFYEEIFKKKLKVIKKVKINYFSTLLILIISIILFSSIFGVNIIYTLILAQAITAFSIILSRKDLLKESLLGGITFTTLYILIFLLMNQIFPNWISNTWNLSATYGITFLELPIEEYLWTFTFGMLWAPIYEYLKDYKLI